MTDLREELKEQLIAWAVVEENVLVEDGSGEYCIFCHAERQSRIEPHLDDCLHLRAVRIKEQGDTTP